MKTFLNENFKYILLSIGIILLVINIDLFRSKSDEYSDYKKLMDSQL